MKKQKLGLAKLAQDETTVVPPEGDSQNTVVTCMSDCMYSQNPEKTCMLKNISLALGKSGEFSCGQYSPSQEMTQPA